MAFRISSPDLLDAQIAMARAKGETREAMRNSARDAVEGTWIPALASAAGTQPEQRMLVDEASASVDLGSMTLTAAVGGPLSGGLGNWAAIEYGMDPQQITAPNRRKTLRIAGSGRPIRVATQIWVGRNLRPRNDDGYVVFPTIRQHGPRFVAAWIHGLIDTWRGSPFDITPR